MTTNISAVNFDADQKLISLIESKLKKFSLFDDKIITVNVYLKLDNLMHQIKDKVAEIKVTVPGKSYFVKQSSKSFEESFDKAFNSMCNKITRRKEKASA